MSAGGLKTVLEANGYPVVAEAANGQQAVSLARLLRPHQIVMDFEMPLLNGFEAAQQVLREVPVPVLTSDADAPAVRDGVGIGIQALSLGRDELHFLHAIQEVLKGKTYIGPGLFLT
jgi:DNA-binding NarL/FixJ family response regulator